MVFADRLSRVCAASRYQGELEVVVSPVPVVTTPDAFLIVGSNRVETVGPKSGRSNNLRG